MSDHAEILARLDTLTAELRALRAHTAAAASPILTVAEAMELSRTESRSAFHRWCQRWRVPVATPGRYARRAILAALEREAQSGRRRTKPAATPAVDLSHAEERVAA